MLEDQATPSEERRSVTRGTETGEPPSDFALALTILRQSRGWNQHQLSRATGITTSALSEYEHGKKMPELKNLRKVVGALGYRMSALERTEDFVRELQAEGALEAWPSRWGGEVLGPAPVLPERISAQSPTLRIRARRTAALMGQAAISFGLLLFDILIGSREGA